MSEVKIRLKEYHKDFVNYLKSINAKYDSLTNTWIVDYSNYEEIKNKIKEFNLDSKIEISVKVPVVKKERPQEGRIVMRLSKDKRYALLTINLLAFKEDIEDLISGKRRTVRFRVLPYRRRTTTPSTQA
jgi:sugar-specific transcriptional regulator TrmB